LTLKSSFYSLKWLPEKIFKHREYRGVLIVEPTEELDTSQPSHKEAEMSISRILIPILIIFLIFGLISSANADARMGILKGTITDRQTGQPISGAVVEIGKADLKAITDHNGFFEFKAVPDGVYQVIIKASGYNSLKIIRVNITDGIPGVLNFNLAKAEAGKPGSVEAVFASEIQKYETKDGKLSDQPFLLEMEELGLFQAGDVLSAKKEGDAVKGGRQVALNCMSIPAPSSGQWLPHGGTTTPNGEPYSGTFFKHYGVNPFVDTEDDHFSTFAIDVDDASYSVARAYIEGGNLPNPASVRTEEFVNFFNYDYPAPQHERFRVYIEGAPSEFGQNCDLIRIGIKGQEINPKDRKPAVLTFVIDVSGSMGIDSRLGMVKKALRILVDNLRDDDLVGIAIYGSRGEKYLDHMSIKKKDEILFAIDRLCTGGATNAEEGLKIAYKMASDNFKEGAINRIILCSDGVANVGRTGADDILEEIKDYVEKGITLTTVGFGMANYNDILMEKLGDKGNGHFAYVDNLEQAKRVFMQNLTGTLQVIAKDVKIQVDFDPAKVRSYRLLGYENRDVADEKFRDDKEDGGEIGSGHDVTALYEVKFRDGASGKFATVYIRHKDPDRKDEVTEKSFPLSMSDIKSNFAKSSSSFRLAACAAEFAEILRESYWAKDGDLGKVLALAQELSYENKDNDDIIEFTAMVSRAKKLWDEKELHSSED
jgi:Ca-activated chloride channel family protein